jgi:hypothetical protein
MTNNSTLMNIEHLFFRQLHLLLGAETEGIAGAIGRLVVGYWAVPLYRRNLR